MSKAEGQQILRDAKKAGKAYARESVESEFFQDHIADQIYSADLDDLATTKKEAYRHARDNEGEAAAESKV